MVGPIEARHHDFRDEAAGAIWVCGGKVGRGDFAGFPPAAGDEELLDLVCARELRRG